MRHRNLFAAVATTLLVLGVAPAAAHADTIDPRIAQALETVAGGEALDSHTAYWPEQHMTLTVDDDDIVPFSAVGSCPDGSICAYAGLALTGARLSWTTCGTHSTSALGAPVRSIADARSTGMLQARNGTTVVATAYAQSWAGVTGTSDNVKCS